MRVRRARWLSVAAAILLTGLCTPALGAAASSSPPAATRSLTAAPVPTQDGPDADAARTVAGMTTAEQAASVVMGHIPSTDAAALTAYMSQGLGGFILMGANIPATSAELETLTAALVVDPSLPPLIAVDQEGGLVSRLPADDYASSRMLKGLPVAATSAAFSARGALVAQSGIDVDFGTIADVTADP